jgi:hypothetical protein
MHIPKTGVASFRIDVPLHEDASGCGTLGRHDTVAHLERTLVARLCTDLKGGFGVVLVAKEFTSSHEHGPNLSNDLDVLFSRDGDSLGNEVSAMVDKQDLTVF